MLDFQKIKTAEREAAVALFSGVVAARVLVAGTSVGSAGAAGEKLLQEIAAARTMSADGQMGAGENRLTGNNAAAAAAGI